MGRRGETWARRAARSSAAYAGCSLAILGVEGFLAPHGLASGGTIGLAAFAADWIGMAPWLGILLIGLPWLLACRPGVRGASRKRSAAASRAVGLTIAALGSMALRPMAALSDELVVSALAGGLLTGGGIGIALRFGHPFDPAYAGAAPRANSRQRAAPFFRLTAPLTLHASAVILAAAASGQEAAFATAIGCAVFHEAFRNARYGLPFVRKVRIASRKEREVKEALRQGMGTNVWSDPSALRGNGPPTVPVFCCEVARLEKEKLYALVKDVDPEAEISIERSAWGG